MEERAKQRVEEREKERVLLPGFIYPRGNCNVPPCHRPINGASLPFSASSLFPHPTLPSLSPRLPHSSSYANLPTFRHCLPLFARPA